MVPEPEQLVMKIKKSQLDLTAGLVYALGISLVHFVLLVTAAAIVVWPNPEVAKEMDEAFNFEKELSASGNSPFLAATKDFSCYTRAVAQESLMENIIITHGVCLIVNLFREVFETKLGTLGQLMRLAEVASLAFYFSVIVEAANCEAWLFRMENFQKEYVPSEHGRPCLMDKNKFVEWAGQS